METDTELNSLFTDVLPEQLSESVTDLPIVSGAADRIPDSKIVEKRAGDSDKQKFHQLPLSRVKQIMKMDPDVQMASSESVFLIAKCAELFIKLLSKESHSYTVASKKKTVQKKDVDSAINNSRTLIFLEGALD